MSEHDPNVEEPNAPTSDAVEDLDVPEEESEDVKGGASTSIGSADGDLSVVDPTIKNAWPKKYT